ncbi:hypothetical protein SBADM41S_11860 [Streptomyces badius]
MSASTAPPPRTPATSKKPRPTGSARRRSTALGLAAWAVGIVFCLPALWMVLTSFPTRRPTRRPTRPHWRPR